MAYATEEIRRRVCAAADEYNAHAPADARIAGVSLFGSYADGRQHEGSDIDLLVKFSSAVVSLFSLAKVLEAMESRFSVPVDVVQDPLPKDALLEITSKVPLYEAV